MKSRWTNFFIFILVIAIMLFLTGILKPIFALLDEAHQQTYQEAYSLYFIVPPTEEESNELLKTLDFVHDGEVETVDEVDEVERTVIFSNYHVGDRTGEVDQTKSGLKSKDFQTNDLGWHTYNGCVVISAAHRDMGTVRDGFSYHEIGELINFTFDNSDYCGIVLDTGSAMMGWGNEVHQRYDIRVNGTSHDFGLVKGTLYE